MQPEEPLQTNQANIVTGGGQASPVQQTPTPPPQSGKQPNDPKSQPKVKQNLNTTQNSLLLSEIRDNMVIMNDGTMRTVIACRSINFDLMSNREREAVEYSYQDFLNSLYFPIQILIRSQKVDIGPYIDKLSKLRLQQDNMLLGVLMDDYIDFIAAISQETNIMDKDFYIIIPYYPGGDVGSAVNSSRSFLSNLLSPQTQQRIRINEDTFNKAKDELRNRTQTAMTGLSQIGIRSVQLETKELGELYYNTYNPDTAVRQPLGNFDNLTAPIVTKGQGEAPRPHINRET